MKKIIILLSIFALCCEDTINENENSSLLFVASEGSYGDGDGSITVFKNGEEIQVIDNLGDVVNSILINEDKLFVIVNNSHLIKRFSITESGLNLPGIEVSTDNSSPREMVVEGDKLYFTNWNSKDIKVLNLNTFSIESSIPVEGLPEDIISDGTFLWVSIPNLELYDTNNGSSVIKIDLNSQNIVESHEVGNGPGDLILDNQTLWISRTFYSSDWSAFYGSSSINTESNEIITRNYGAGMVCGGNILKINDQIYRTVDGGVAPLDVELDINLAAKIGSYSNLYSAFSNNENIYLGMSDYVAPDTVFVHDASGVLIRELSVGQLPGDYAIWEKN